MEDEQKAAAACCCGTFTLIFFIITSCLKVVLPTEVAVEMNWVWNTIENEPHTKPGLYVRSPLKSFISYPTTWENLQFDTQTANLDGRTADGLPIFVGVSLQYKLIPEEVVQLYKEIEFTVGDYVTLFKLHAMHIITEEACKYDASAFFNDKITIATNMQKAMDEHFRKYLHAHVDSLQLNSEELPDKFTTTVLNASAMRQNITKAQNTKKAKLVEQATNVVVAENQAKIMIQQAVGESIKITNNGEADANIIKYFADAESDMYSNVSSNLNFTAAELLAYIWYDGLGDGNTVATGDGLELFAGINPGAYFKE